MSYPPSSDPAGGLPPSSAAIRPPSSSAPDHRPPRARAVDLLNLAGSRNSNAGDRRIDDDDDEADVNPARRNRPRRGPGFDGDVPRVKDATGEEVTKTFQSFLEK